MIFLAAFKSDLLKKNTFQTHDNLEWARNQRKINQNQQPQSWL